MAETLGNSKRIYGTHEFLEIVTGNKLLEKI